MNGKHKPLSAFGWAMAMLLLAVVTSYGMFWLPFEFPPTRRLCSASYAFGFNNGVSIIVLGLAVAVAVFIYLSRGRRSPVLFEPRNIRRTTRRLWFALALMAVLYAIATGLFCYYQLTSAPSLMWEVRHLNYRTLLMDIYHLHPYTDFSAEYGPLLTYAPLWTYWLLRPLGMSYDIAYFVCHFLFNLAGLCCITYVLSQSKISQRRKSIIFIALAIAGFAPYMGMNGVLLRYLLPVATLIVGSDAIQRLQIVRQSGLRWLADGALVFSLVTANLLLSSEAGVAFAFAWLSYCIFYFRRQPDLIVTSLLGMGLVASLIWLIAPAAYYTTLVEFSKGANNLPLLPAPHILLYLLTLFLLVPPLLSPIVKRPSKIVPETALAGAAGVLCLAMAPGALGRCDPPHVLLFGMGASLLVMIRLATIGRLAVGIYAVAYFAVFVLWMELVNLHVFYNVSVKQFFSPRGVAEVISILRHAGAKQAVTDISLLDQYSRIGLPFATFGDAVTENYVVRNGKLEPEYYVAIVGIYTAADLRRKLVDLAAMKYILVPRGLETRSTGHACQGMLWNLRAWFLLPVKLPCRADPIDPVGETSSYVASHFSPLADIGPAVLMRRATVEDDSQ